MPSKESPLTWTKSMSERLRRLREQNEDMTWIGIASSMSKLFGLTLTDNQCIQHYHNVILPERKGPFSAEEDSCLRDAIGDVTVDAIDWSFVSSKVPGRCGKQCRERWDILSHKNGPLTQDEIDYITDHMASSPSEVAKELDRPVSTIRNKVNSIKKNISKVSFTGDSSSGKRQLELLPVAVVDEENLVYESPKKKPSPRVATVSNQLVFPFPACGSPVGTDTECSPNSSFISSRDSCTFTPIDAMSIYHSDCTTSCPTSQIITSYYGSPVGTDTSYLSEVSNQYSSFVTYRCIDSDATCDFNSLCQVSHNTPAPAGEAFVDDPSLDELLLQNATGINQILLSGDGTHVYDAMVVFRNIPMTDQPEVEIVDLDTSFPGINELSGADDAIEIIDHFDSLISICGVSIFEEHDVSDEIDSFYQDFSFLSISEDVDDQFITTDQCFSLSMFDEDA